MLQAILSLALLTGAADATTIDGEPAPLNKEVAAAARYFRIQVYHTYRTHRSEYNRRRELGDEVLNQWKESGQPEEQREAVLQWFRQARQAALAGGQTPEAPEMKAATDLDLDQEELAGPTAPVEPTPPATVPALATPAPAPVAESVVEPAESSVSTPELPGPPVALPPLKTTVSEEPALAPAKEVEKSKTEADKDVKDTTGDILKAVDPLPPLPAPWNGSVEPSFTPPLPLPATPARSTSSGSGSR